MEQWDIAFSGIDAFILNYYQWKLYRKKALFFIDLSYILGTGLKGYKLSIKKIQTIKESRLYLVGDS